MPRNSPDYLQWCRRNKMKPFENKTNEKSTGLSYPLREVYLPENKDIKWRQDI